MADLLAVVRSYYEALGSGDAERIAAHFTEDAVHYYTRRDPHVGARAIAENAVLGTDAIQGRWVLENGVADSEQAAIEWTMTWADPRSGEARLDRGAEFFSFREGRISEVRAYYHGGVPKNPSGDLVGFDHAGRGHTVLP